MIKDKIFALKEIKFSKKAKKITVTAVITFVVFLFFIWLGVGMYVSVPEAGRGELWPMYGMYAVFPLLIFYFGAKRVYDIVNGDDDEEEPETEEQEETEE
ncbi:MAG: hypothetical protein IJO01_06060 [Oscillospiraceae bacterium]|nr:hypothetical protein [Oscillospiraceae bacterium]